MTSCTVCQRFIPLQETFAFQQDNAPAYRAGDTMELLSCNTPDFISQNCCGHPIALTQIPRTMKCGACSSNTSTVMSDVSHLKQRLIDEWRCFDQNIMDWAVWQWHVRLRARVHATAWSVGLSVGLSPSEPGKNGKRLQRSRYRLHWGLGWAQRNTCCI